MNDSTRAHLIVVALLLALAPLRADAAPLAGARIQHTEATAKRRVKRDLRGRIADGLIATSAVWVALAGGPPIARGVAALVPDPPATVYTNPSQEPALLRKDLGGAAFSSFPGARLFVDGVSVHDVKQTGALGDCGLIASLADVAYLDPQRITNSLAVAPDGQVRFTGYRPLAPRWARVRADGSLAPDGDAPAPGAERLEVTMSPTLPRTASLFSAFAGGSTPRYLVKRSTYASSADTKELWGPMIEKAFATSYQGKHGSGYEGLTSIPPYTVLSVLTGRPSSYFYTVDNPAEQTWQALKLATRTGHFVVADTIEKGTWHDVQLLAHGLYTQHAYSVLGTDERGGRRYVTLRNPHGFRMSLLGIPVGSDVFELELKTYMKAIDHTVVN